MNWIMVLLIADLLSTAWFYSMIRFFFSASIFTMQEEYGNYFLWFTNFLFLYLSVSENRKRQCSNRILVYEHCLV